MIRIAESRPPKPVKIIAVHAARSSAVAVIGARGERPRTCDARRWAYKRDLIRQRQERAAKADPFHRNLLTVAAGSPGGHTAYCRKLIHVRPASDALPSPARSATCRRVKPSALAPWPL